MRKKKKNTKCAPEGNQILPIHKVNDAEKCTGFTKMFSKGLKKKKYNNFMLHRKCIFVH